MHSTTNMAMGFQTIGYFMSDIVKNIDNIKENLKLENCASTDTAPNQNK